MLRHHRTVGLVVVAVAALWGSTAYAQGGRGFGMMGGGIFFVAGNEAVQKEIGIDSAAASKLQRIVEEYRQDMRTENERGGINFQALQDLSPEERDKRMKEINDKRAVIIKKLNEKFVPQLKEALSSLQFERLQQIGWQAGGSQAVVTDPQLAKELDHKNDQIEKIAAINMEYQRKQRELFTPGGGGDFQAVFIKILDLNKERDGKAMELLTKDQQAKLANLKGTAFDLKLLMPRPQ
jgi:hypothetical protein